MRTPALTRPRRAATPRELRRLGRDLDLDAAGAERLRRLLAPVHRGTLYLT
jgi:hypothetical protein